jgi:hypothetical protein
MALPGREKLLGCSSAEVRQLYQRRYRHFWNLPGWRLVLLSGDIHIGCVHWIEWKKALYQMISSPITHDTGLLIPWTSKLIMRSHSQIATQTGCLRAAGRFLPGIGRQTKNPFSKRSSFVA